MINYWLQSALTSAGLTQADLAKRLGEALSRSVDRAAVNKMISGERRILADEMIEASRICNFPLPQLGKPLGEFQRAIVAIEASIDTSEIAEVGGKLLNDDIVQIRVARLVEIIQKSLADGGMQAEEARKAADEAVQQVTSKASGTQAFWID